MANPSLPTMVDVATQCDAALRQELDPHGLGLAKNLPGSDNAALVSMTAKGTGRLIEYVSDRVAARDIDNAEGTDLDDLARDRFREKRGTPTAAVGTVYLQRSGPMPVTTIPAGNRFSTEAAENQAAVEFSADVVIPVGSGVSKVAVPVTCLQEGPAGNINRSALTRILDPLPDTTWTIFTPLPGDLVLAGGDVDVFGGGELDETDPEFKARLRQLRVDAEAGTLAGILQGALATAGIVYVDLVEPFDGTLVVYAGDTNWLLPAALKTRLQTELEKWRAYGAPILLRAYNVQTVIVTANAHMARALKNYERVILKADANQKVKDYFKTGRPRPDEYYRGAIRGAIFRAHDELQEVTLTSPATDQARPADSSYGAISALNRYVVDDASITINFLEPLTS